MTRHERKEAGAAGSSLLEAPLVASRRSLLLDYFRVPYEVDSRGSGARSGRQERGLPHCATTRRRGATGYVSAYTAGAAEGIDQLEFRIHSMRLFGSLVPTSIAEAWLEKSGETWVNETPIVDPAGRNLSWIWRSHDGSVFFPFDPDEVMFNLRSERYQTLSGVTTAARISTLGGPLYYQLRRYVPKSLLIALRRAFSRLQSRAVFPRWPIESSLHDLHRFVLGSIEEVAGAGVPWIAPWPDGRTWALVLTHDVEGEAGLDNIEPILRLEDSLGYRSSWNLVGRRYRIDATVVDMLREHGFEVGVHGLFHDGRLFESLETLEGRLEEMRASATEWGAVGFRSPATHRNWDWMPLLGFDYDSSYPDTDPYEPQPGGCCSWLPFFNGELVELPLTLPQDHTLFVILRKGGAESWIQKARFLRERGGMALIDTHPDYLLERGPMEAYRAFLEHFAADESAWRALPHEVAAWWRRRAASHLEPSPESGWRVVGPAADEATVQIGFARKAGAKTDRGTQVVTRH